MFIFLNKTNYIELMNINELIDKQQIFIKMSKELIDSSIDKINSWIINNKKCIGKFCYLINNDKINEELIKLNDIKNHHKSQTM